jgi:pyruvate dehydrogenase E1 component alpha subunit
VPGREVDGNDVSAVYQATEQLIAKVRVGAPRFLHAKTWRVRGHVSVDVQGYRDQADLKAAADADPLRLAREQAMAAGVSAADLDAALAAAQAEADEAVRFAHASPWPQTEAAYTDVQTLGAGTWR